MSSYYEKILATGEVKCIDEEVPFEIPKGWEWCRLVEVGKTETGTTPSKSHPEYFGDYIPFLGPANILNSKIVSVTQGLSDIGVDYGRIVPKNTILQVCIGGSIGKCAITDKPVTFNQQINSITPYLCNVEFVHIVLQSEYFRLAIMDKATGTATPIINRGNWETLLFPLPPIKEQERIVANITELTHFLGIYSNKQEELNTLNTNMYQRMKKAILQEAIQGKLVPQIAEEGTAQELLEQIKTEKQKLVKNGKLKKSALAVSTIFRGDDNKYWEKSTECMECIDDKIPFDIPSTWCWVRHNQLFEISGGSQPPKSQFVDSPKSGYIRLYQIRDYGSNPMPVYIPQEKANKITKEGDIILARYGGSLGKVFWAKDGAYNVAMAKVIPLFDSEFVNKQYLFLFYQSSIYQYLVKDHSRSAQAGFNKDDLKDLFFPLPPLEEQSRIVEIYKSVTSIMSR